jgi:hypothetical protein
MVDLNFDQPYLLHTNLFEVIFMSLESYRRALFFKSIDGIFQEHLGYLNFEHFMNPRLDLCEHYGSSWTFYF